VGEVAGAEDRYGSQESLKAHGQEAEARQERVRVGLAAGGLANQKCDGRRRQQCRHNGHRQQLPVGETGAQQSQDHERREHSSQRVHRALEAEGTTVGRRSNRFRKQRFARRRSQASRQPGQRPAGQYHRPACPDGDPSRRYSHECIAAGAERLTLFQSIGPPATVEFGQGRETVRNAFYSPERGRRHPHGGQQRGQHGCHGFMAQVARK
jgi:hypothetical protein